MTVENDTQAMHDKQDRREQKRPPLPLSPALFVATAAAFIGLGAEVVEPRFTIADVFLRGVNAAPGLAWDAAFVHHVGHWSHYDVEIGRSLWPLPPTVSCTDLGEFARERGILRTTPCPGDVFLLSTSDGRHFHRCGIVTSVTDAAVDADRPVVCRTIEGHLRRDGEPGGRSVSAAQRTFSPLTGDRFIRWVDLDVRRAPSEPTVKHETVMGRPVVRRVA